MHVGEDPMLGYSTLTDLHARMHTYAVQAGGQVHTLGHSVEGRPIFGVELKANQPTDKSVLWCANLHGVEFIGAEMTLAALSDAAVTGGLVDQLRSRAHVWLLPCLNPDGYALTWHRHGRGVLADLRKNARGVDLNRNFPKPGVAKRVWPTLNGWRTGSDDPANAFYRGTSPLSEPETQAVSALSRRVNFHAGLNSHSTMGTLILPCLTVPAMSRHYAGLVRAFQSAQPWHRYLRLSARWLDTFTGEQEDWQHHQLDMWSICVEHYPIWTEWTRFVGGRSLFRRFNPPDRRRWIENDLPGVVAYFMTALDCPRPSQS
ncbi:MAG: M14 family metallopeptidase [Myxococcota bacterium]|nr:M14 family metallopeptidase [Myxococcota bacterium]